MADSWEDEADEFYSAVAGGPDTSRAPATLAAPITDKWDGEDEDDDVPDAWDAEPTEQKKPTTTGEASASAAGGGNKSKKRSKVVAAAAEKKRLEAEEKQRAAAAAAAAASSSEAGDDAAAENSKLSKEELRRIQEEADLLVAKDTFGVNDAVAAGAIDPQKSIDLLQPVSKADFDQLASLISKKLRQLETSPHFPQFVESLFRDCTVELDCDTLRKLSTMFSAIASERQKLLKQQGAGKGAAKKKGKGVVKVERDATGAGLDEDFGYDEYDDFI